MNPTDFAAHDPPGIDGVLDVVRLAGSRASPMTVPDLLVEVPHGADRRADYDRVRAALTGDLPAGLEAFFHVNTDVGAWDLGLATAGRLLALAPQRTVALIRCLVPRTFIDCNRPAGHPGGDLGKGALTAGIPDYVRDGRDRAHLIALHARYVEYVEAAYRAICGAGGLALTPHTYAPRSVGIRTVGDDIVEQLEWAYEPERYATWPLRAEIDLLTRDPDGRYLAPPGLERKLIEAFTAERRDVRANATYNLAPGSLGAQWSSRFEGQVLCLEVRRDLLVSEWRPFEPMTVDAARVDAIGATLAHALAHALGERGESAENGDGPSGVGH